MHETMDWFKIGKEYDKAVYCHPAHLTYIQSTSGEMLGSMNHRLESRLPGEISTISDIVHDTTLIVESENELKSLLRGKKESEINK